jgi:hypothetical protein
MPTNVEAEIRARLEQFAAKLTSLIQRSAMSSVEDAFAGGSAPAGRGRRAAAAAAPSLRAAGARKGQKRDPRLLEALTEKLGGYIAKNPGLRIEQIGEALGVATKDLALPVKKLIAAKRVSTKGQKRATTYFAGGGRGGKPGPKAKPKAAKASKAKTRRGSKATKAAKPAKAKKSKKARAAKPKAQSKRVVKGARDKKSVKPSAPAVPAASPEGSGAAAE